MLCFVLAEYVETTSGVIVMGIYMYIYIHIRAVTDLTAFSYENKWMQASIQVLIRRFHALVYFFNMTRRA